MFWIHYYDTFSLNNNIHSFYYYLIIQMVVGLFQFTGWPSVVVVVWNWFGKKKWGLIIGFCNTHTSVGNITGSLVASMLLNCIAARQNLNSGASKALF